MERQRRWKNLKQRLGLKVMGCCGSFWGSRAPTQMNEREEEEEDEIHEAMAVENPIGSTNGGCLVGQMPGTAGMMNLAAALAAERQFRATERQSLMRLLGEGGEDGEAEESGGGGDRTAEEVKRWWCCVCMERRKGAAFIPCGHTFCRVCTRELWLNRGFCPLCNRQVLDVLDIF
ncbi:zinc finger protein [Cinnamomum micranthum f. kanehirae]|uniref:Zinc finger protein n=1 Tax=Cinnamomum micranthum f. kanehirae TaxID=337451 RepID=A0A3S3N8G2_9MAGN|nr:zinc finger protein [Cinnamomum micranthum f. kanehirae]